MVRKFVVANALWAVDYIRDIAASSKIECFPVSDNNKLIGVITMEDLLTAHPNRIAIDAMSGVFEYIQETVSIWEARAVLEEKGLQLLVAGNENAVKGIVPEKILRDELAVHIDLLTGLNKSDFMYYKAYEMLISQRDISVIFFDVNNFGALNKDYGHTVGDEILQELALLLRANMPENSFLCRFGGDEFALLSPLPVEDCTHYAREILEVILKHRFPQDIEVSVSAGIAGSGGLKPANADISGLISSVVNRASIASTKAKIEKDNVAVDYPGILKGVAM